MDLYNLVEKIPFMILFFTAVAFVYLFFFGGLGNLQEEIDQAQKDSYRRAVVLENLLSVKMTESQRTEFFGDRYNLVERRAILSMQFFLQSNQGDEPGYMVNEDHCYIPKVSGLDGQNYGFYIEMTEDVDDPPDLGCTTARSPSNAVSSPALLLRGGQDTYRVPARIYVYEINPYSTVDVPSP